MDVVFFPSVCKHWTTATPQKNQGSSAASPCHVTPPAPEAPTAVVCEAQHLVYHGGSDDGSGTGGRARRVQRVPGTSALLGALLLKTHSHDRSHAEKKALV